MMSITDWIQAISTLVLVGVTVFYAWQSKKTVNEMKKQRYDTVRPVIDIYRDPTGEDKMSEAIAAIDGNPTRGLSCVLHNIGLGPAIDLYTYIQTSNGSQRYDYGTLAVGEKTPRMNLSMINEANEDHPRDLLLIAEYKDVYDREFFSSRNVFIDKEKCWVLTSLFTHPSEGENRLL